MKKVKLLITLGILGTFAACTNSSNGSTQANGDQKTAAPAAASSTVYKSDDLYTLYEKDYEMGKGNPKMDSSLVQIKDKVTKIVENPGTGFYVYFGSQSAGGGADGFDTPKIQALFKGAEAQKVQNMKPGDDISLQGKIMNGEFKTITLDNCVVK